MVGQIITGAGQPFVLNIPTHYSDKWFSATSRVSATALMSLANAIGAAVGQLVNPFLAPNVNDIPNMVHYFTVSWSEITLASLFRYHCFGGLCCCTIHSCDTSFSSCTVNNSPETPSQGISSCPLTKLQFLVPLYSCTLSSFWHS